MATLRTVDGPSAQPADPVDKMNGDDDLDFTITMNAMSDDDDDSNDDSANESAAAEKSQSVKVNGKKTSDNESPNCAGGEKSEGGEDSGKGGEGKLKEKELAGSVDDPVFQEAGSNGHVNAPQGSNPDAQDEHVEGKTEDNQTGEAAADCKKEKERLEEKENHVEEKMSRKGTEPDVITGKGDGKINPQSNDNDLSDDDDVVEITGSPMKFPVKAPASNLLSPSTSRGRQNPPGVSVSAASSGSLNLNSVPPNLIPYLASMPGVSFLPTTGGVQLVLPSGATNVPGTGGSLFIPNGALIGPVTSTASVFQPATGSSVLVPMVSGQPNRNAMASLNQPAKPAPAMHPALNNIPEKPTSSMGMLEMIRWEVDNHISIKPKYVKPQPKAELGHLAKWMFDLGSDIAKEYVYHDLVRIQRRRKDEGNLSEKEKNDFAKLQGIDRELNDKVGHLKIRLNKSCNCGFRTELRNVLYNHQQHAHVERGGMFRCVLCKFTSRQGSSFRFHMEAEHGRAGFLESRRSFYECSLCPYETNYTNRLDQHKVRCLRQYRESVNLHPSCLTGPEVNMCLENVFYFVFTRQFMNTIMPKAQTLARPPPTKIRDMPGGSEAPQQGAQPRTVPPVAHSALAPTGKQILPRNAVQSPPTTAPITKQQTQARKAVPGVQQIIGSRMNAVHSQLSAPSASSGRLQQPPPSQPPAPNQSNNGFEVCEICGGYVKDRKALRIHFFYAHRIDMPFGVFERPQPPLYCATCFARFWTAQGLQKHIEVHKNDMLNATQTNNGVAGKCISCGHRVPNILMHMRMVHNREMRHYLAALMCIFCGARFPKKPDVENHMGQVHGVLVKNNNVQGGVATPPPTPPASKARPPASKTQPKPTPPKSGNSSGDGGGGSKSGRNCQCVLCNLSFHRNVDLTRHCMRVHHTCMKCGLVVVDKESLVKHTCLHSASGMRTCQICCEPGFHPAYYIKHMRDKHLRKCSVVLRHIDRAVVETMKRPITISDSEEEEAVHMPPAPKLKKKEMEERMRKNQSADMMPQDHSSKAPAEGGEGAAGSSSDQGPQACAGKADSAAEDDAAEENQHEELGDGAEGRAEDSEREQDCEGGKVKAGDSEADIGDSSTGIGNGAREQREGEVDKSLNTSLSKQPCSDLEVFPENDSAVATTDGCAEDKTDSAAEQCSAEADSDASLRKRRLRNMDDDERSSQLKSPKLGSSSREDSS